MKNGVLMLLFLFVILSACQLQKQEIANPASEKCIKDGFESTVNNNINGSLGYCQKTVNNIIVKCEEWAYFNKKCDMNRCDTCPEIVTPAPNFCENGKLIVGEKNECGCSLPPKCEKNTEKLLINYPWNKGEKWTLTTNFHDENCLDFVDTYNKNSPVVSAANGEVVLSEYNYPNDFNTWNDNDMDSIEDMGNFVIIKHRENTYSVYMHLKQSKTPFVKGGELIRSGTMLGYAGNTGKSHGEHLHFCIVGVSFFPVPTFSSKPLDSWGFIENEDSNILILNKEYESQNSK